MTLWGKTGLKLQIGRKNDKCYDTQALEKAAFLRK
jgi:hypothetical protein